MHQEQQQQPTTSSNNTKFEDIIIVLHDAEDTLLPRVKERVYKQDYSCNIIGKIFLIIIFFL